MFCNECGTKIPDDSEFCGECGQRLVVGASATATGAAAAPARKTVTPAPTEITFYMDRQGVRVTNTRLIVGYTTYSMSNISSVELTMTSPDYKGPICLLGFGALCVAAGLREGSGPVLFLAACLIGGGIMWLRSLKPTYKLGIQSSSGKFSPIEDRERERIDKIVQAINEAMISRG